jgi:hypothetical protein
LTNWDGGIAARVGVFREAELPSAGVGCWAEWTLSGAKGEKVFRRGSRRGGLESWVLGASQRGWGCETRDFGWNMSEL